MRFALDSVWLDGDGRVVDVEEAVRPWRVRRAVTPPRCWRFPPAEAGAPPPPSALEECRSWPNRSATGWQSRSTRRVPIYRDTYNEYFVLVLSAGGAAAGTQAPLYLVMAITGIWNVRHLDRRLCVVFEFVAIFGLARPQMQPRERLAGCALGRNDGDHGAGVLMTWSPNRCSDRRLVPAGRAGVD